MTVHKSQDNYEAQTLILNDSNGNELFCYLEQIVKVEEKEYALLTPVDTPVILFKINEKDEPELIDKIEKNEQVLNNADAVLQEHDLKLIRSAVTLTVSAELEEPIYDELEEDGLNDESETYELLVNFNLLEQEYGLYIPLDPFFIVGKLEGQGALLIEDDEFDKVQPLIETELEKSSLYNNEFYCKSTLGF